MKAMLWIMLWVASGVNAGAQFGNDNLWFAAVSFLVMCFAFDKMSKLPWSTEITIRRKK